MADCIIEQITANLLTTLDGVSTYGGDCDVERERAMLTQGDRDPLIVLSGPEVEVEQQIDAVSVVRCQYVAAYLKRINDEGVIVNTEAPYLARNVSADIMKALMIDRSRGSLALNTEVEGYGYTFLPDEQSGEITFSVYVAFNVRARVSTTDPYYNA